MNIYIYTNYVYRLLKECVFILKRIIFRIDGVEFIRNDFIKKLLEDLPRKTES